LTAASFRVEYSYTENECSWLKNNKNSGAIQSNGAPRWETVLRVPGECGEARTLAEEDVLRARFYGLLASVLASPPSKAVLAALRQIDGDDTDLGRALRALAQVARSVSVEDIADEFATLFVGLTEGELRPYASYYLTGFLYEKPLADLRRDMARLGVRRATGVHEPEDHIASLCEIMQGLILGTFGEAADLDQQKAFFDFRLRPWAARFFADLQQARAAAFYRPIGQVGGVFMEVEREAFAIAA
jgi:TorA maturation chaperone TorD